MRRVLALCLAVASLVASASASGWLISYDEAMQQSRASGKPVLVYFSGHDWNRKSRKLDHEVFDDLAFQRWASEYVVLLDIDFPHEGGQPTGLEVQNDELMRHYQSTTIPMCFVLATDGKVVARQGYERGGADHWVQTLKTKVDKWLAKHG
jgi:hypothetical protein